MKGCELLWAAGPIRWVHQMCGSKFSQDGRLVA